MDIEELKAFCEIVEKKSFSQVAEIFHITQPAVSFQIQSLEKHFGTKLLDRFPQGVELTPKGEVLYEYAQKILELYEQSRQSIAKMDGVLRGRLVIGSSTIPGHYILPKLMGQFKKEHPQVYPILRVMDTQKVVSSVLKRALELGVVGAIIETDNLRFEEFIKDELILIVPSSSGWQNRKELTWEQLRKEPFIMHEEGSGISIIVKRKLDEIGFSLDDLNVIMELEGTSAIKTAVEAGLGVSIVPECSVKNEIKLGQIKSVKIKNSPLKRNFYFVYHKRRTLSPICKTFLKFAKIGR